MSHIFQRINMLFTHSHTLPLLGLGGGRYIVAVLHERLMKMHFQQVAPLALVYAIYTPSHIIRFQQLRLDTWNTFLPTSSPSPSHYTFSLRYALTSLLRYQQLALDIEKAAVHLVILSDTPELTPQGTILITTSPHHNPFFPYIMPHCSSQSSAIPNLL